MAVSIELILGALHTEYYTNHLNRRFTSIFMLGGMHQYRGMDQDVKTQLGGRIRELREARGLTQAELAKLVLKSVETISNFERGKTAPSVMTLTSLATQLNTELKDLFDFELSAGKGELDQFSAAIEMKAKLLSEVDRQLVADFVHLLVKRQ